MPKVLIVEDDTGIARGISEALYMWNMETRTVSDFRNVTQEFGEYAPHLVLMDISLPMCDGYHWCQEIRKISKVPVIFISSAADSMNIIMAINMGADDFIAKPFDLNVLVAKIQAILRQTYDFTESCSIIVHNGASLNTDSGTLFCGGEEIPLTKNEYRILFTLMKNRGKIVSRERLMDALWKTDTFVDENTLTVNINRLRKKLDAAGLNDYIKTKFGIGYTV